MDIFSKIVQPADMEAVGVPNTIFLYVGAGIVFILFSIVLIIVIFGLATKKSMENYPGMAVLLVILIALPAAIVFIGRESYFKSYAAENIIDTNQVEVISMNDEFFVVTYYTPQPEISYIQVTTEDGSIIPVLPTYSLEKRVDHTILVPKYMRTQEVYVVVRGKNYQIHL